MDKYRRGAVGPVFETEEELAALQELLDASFARAGEHILSTFDSGHRMSAPQVSGFQGMRQVAVATVNSRGEPRVAPRNASFIHGMFILAANSKSTMVGRLARRPSIGLTYFEDDLMIVLHGTALPFRRESPGFESTRPEWERAHGKSLRELGDINLLIRVDAANMLAFAQFPQSFPGAWSGPLGRGRPSGQPQAESAV
jgi:Pyridoxamine 5'-phosphate oxidase